MESAFSFFGAPGAIRTPDPLVRSQVLYPAELRAPGQYYTTYCLFLKVIITILLVGGERGIRTLDTGLSPYASLAGKCLRPLGQLSVYSISLLVVFTNKGAILLDSRPKINQKTVTNCYN